MLSEEKIKHNKEEFISIAKTINREGMDELIKALEESDFFVAPASTKYHLNVKGGLCEHSLNVYYNMLKLRDTFCPGIEDETCKVSALFHDLAKVNFYEEYAQNVKEYSPRGSKRDEMGNFDWVAKKAYKVKSASDRDFVCSTHGVNSYILLSKYIKLYQQERAAIINHHSGLDDGMANNDIGEVFNRYPAATILHMADYLATYINENPYMIDE